MPLSFIHAADFHLGANLRRFGPAAKHLEEAQYNALKLALEAAGSRHADFVLICGDLFDSRHSSPAVVEKTRSIVSCFPDIPIFVLPGTHDFLGDDSVLSPSKQAWAPANVVILNGRQPMPFPLADVDAHLYFRPNRSNRSTRSPIQDVHRVQKKGHHIGLAHGSLKFGRPGFESDFPIKPAEIEKSGLDYLALGHWHSPRVERYGRTATVYPGIPQPISFSDPELGSAFFVDLDESASIMPEPIATSTIRLKQVAADIYHPQDLENLIDENADDKTIIKMDLRYSDKMKEKHVVREIIREAETRFMLVQENSHKDRLAGSPVESIGEVNQPLIEAYKAELAHLQEVDSPERGAIYERASELGIKLIKGEI